MRVFVSTSDKYLHLLKKHSYFFNKYWSLDQRVDVLCYQKPDFDLPSNYNIISIGEKSDGYWTDPLRKFMEGIEDRSFVFLLEDLLIIQKVDLELLGRMWGEVEAGWSSKAVLERQSHWRVEPYPHESDMSIIDQKADYRTTTKPSIWRRDYFLKYLKPRYSIWDFETRNPESKGDGSVVVEPRGRDVLMTIDYMHRGKVPDDIREWLEVELKIGRITKEDIDMVLS